jgi:hypothetical protein
MVNVSLKKLYTQKFPLLGDLCIYVTISIAHHIYAFLILNKISLLY